ncbi:MAG TPA: LysR family transcriptional regulator [Aliidongia sp.]|nr:LysR family transcriptional regulator [Aliidongia sp.]
MRRIDLNLFRVFEAVMRHRSVSGAGRELGVTASAVSHALARLRHTLGDELFILGEAGMEPTVRALELAPAVRDGLGRIEIAVNTKPFVPSKALRTFRIASSDHTAVMMLSHLIGRVAKLAPQMNFRIFPFNRLDVVRHLDDGRVDFVLGWFGDLPERMRRVTVGEESEAIVVRAGHPLTKAPVTKERLFAFPYVVVEMTGTAEDTIDGFVDDRGVWRRVWIERLLIEMGDDDQGLVGRVAVSVPHFAAVPSIICRTDMVATLPYRLALRFAEQHDLVILDLPYEPLAVPIELVWHQRAERDAGTQWLIGEFIGTMQELSDTI